MKTNHTLFRAFVACATMLVALACIPIAEPTPTPTPTATHTPTPTSTPKPTNTPTPRPTTTPKPTSTPRPTSTPKPTNTPTPTPKPLPTTPPKPTTPPTAGVAATFLADARRTKDDLMTVKIWFDKLAGEERIYCSTIYAHTIHRPSSTAPANVPDLSLIWNEYQAAIADGQLCLQWMIDFCDQGGGTIDTATFVQRRELSSSALSHAEHVVQALEEMSR